MREDPGRMTAAIERSAVGQKGRRTPTTRLVAGRDGAFKITCTRREIGAWCRGWLRNSVAGQNRTPGFETCTHIAGRFCPPCGSTARQGVEFGEEHVLP